MWLDLKFQTWRDPERTHRNIHPHHSRSVAKQSIIRHYCLLALIIYVKYATILRNCWSKLRRLMPGAIIIAWSPSSSHRDEGIGNRIDKHTGTGIKEGQSCAFPIILYRLVLRHSDRQQHKERERPMQSPAYATRKFQKWRWGSQRGVTKRFYLEMAQPRL